MLRYVVDNALRHTSPGGSVRVEVRADGPEGRVSVSYSGPGPEPENLERVFDPFYRAEPARSRAAGPPDASAGAGLGLALARGLVQAHGGRIWAERSGTGGTVFHFTIPFVTDKGGISTERGRGTHAAPPPHVGEGNDG